MQWAIPVVLLFLLLGVLSPAEDSSDKDDSAETAEQRTDQRTDTSAEEAQARAAQAEVDRRRAAAARRAEALAAVRRTRARRAQAARRREAEALAAEEQRLAEERERQEQEELEAQQQEQEQKCHPNYDPCLDPNASDYDCENGSGDGPEYTGLVTVKGGSDPYDLDRDGDGIGCDS